MQFLRRATEAALLRDGPEVAEVMKIKKGRVNPRFH